MKHLFLIAIFFIDVRVRAESVDADAKSCWGKTVPCAIDAGDLRTDISAGGLEVTLAPHALIEQRDQERVQLVRGQILVSMRSKLKLGTPYAEFSCDKKCAAIFKREDASVTAKALSGQWRVRRLGDPKSYRLDAGLQVSVSEVTDKGVADMELPQSLPWLSTVKEWARLFSGEPEVFKAEVEEFRQAWREAVESASEVHQTSANRSIASHEADLAQQRARAAKQAKEDQRLREIFRRKTLFD